MLNNKNVKKILELLDNNYGKESFCYLNYETPWQLLIATILSAQCTDERVNMVTQNLFKKYPGLVHFANANQLELEKDIYSTGFYRNKAKNIIGCSTMLLKKYDGNIPSEIEKLTELPGVGRKTANVLRSHIFNLPSIIVDTHVKRISYRLGFTDKEDPVKIEFELMDILPKEHWSRYNTQIIAHGRNVCISRSPKCEQCFLNKVCRYYLT